MIDVLVVDQSVLERRLIKKALEEESTIEVISTAANGLIALRKVEQLNPDLILMDIDLPDMGGVEVLGIIKNMRPQTPVIIFTSLAEDAAQATIKALELGASDYIEKPSGAKSFEEGKMLIFRSLVPKIKSLCGLVVPVETPVTPLPIEKPKAIALPFSPRQNYIDLVTIGVSTGGPDALAEIFPTFPADFPVPIVVVQHMPPLFTRNLAKRLDSVSSITVQEGKAGDMLKSGSAWIAPGGFHTEVKKAFEQFIISTNQEPPEVGCRPAVNVLFRSAAKAFGPNVLSVILTGMGKDGLEGSKKIIQAGGTLIAQDENSSVVWGMPGAVARAGLTEKVLPLSQIGEEIVNRVNQTSRGFTYKTNYHEATRF